MFIANAFSRVVFGIHDIVANALATSWLLLWDIGLTLGNFLSPNHKKGFVIASGLPGRGGLWPTFVPARDTDSRSPCPCLNALANHGIFPRDGRNIALKDMARIVAESYNFSDTFAIFTCRFVATMLVKDYNHDAIDLEDLCVHNGIEHDASLTRHDIFHQPDQSKPSQDLIDALLACATGKDDDGKPLMTVTDLSRYSTERRNHSRDSNPQFTLDGQHKTFGSSNSSTMLTIFGGKVADLAVMLKEERIPDGWEPRIRGRGGLTITTFNATVTRLELGIVQERGPRKVRLH